jgi:hypothetical protein
MVRGTGLREKSGGTLGGEAALWELGKESGGWSKWLARRRVFIVYLLDTLSSPSPLEHPPSQDTIKMRNSLELLNDLSSYWAAAWGCNEIIFTERLSRDASTREHVTRFEPQLRVSASRNLHLDSYSSYR